MTDDKQYKNLGNTIRDSVFRAKEAPTMLPDETIEKLGLGEDEVLSMEEVEEEEIDEATKAEIRRRNDNRTKSQMVRDQLIGIAKEFQREVGRINLPDPGSSRYERAGPGSFAKEDASVSEDLLKIKVDAYKIIKALKRASL